jgi:predicted DCC family thiol-disulfide oxidoreductase YuxK
MPAVPAQASPATGHTHLLLYDGQCGLCSRLVPFVLMRDRRAVFRFARLQSDVGKAMVARSGGNADRLTTVYVVTKFETREARVLTKSAAALFVAGELGWPWGVTRFARVVPAVLLDRLYDLIAAIRYWVFGRREQCLAPRPEFRSRFLDEDSR